MSWPKMIQNVLISVTFSLEVWFAKEHGNKGQSTIKKINKLGHYCNFLRKSFSELCVNQAVVGAVFIFELKLSTSFDREMTYYFVLYLFSNLM